jgi:ubiquinone/menaquinone biosynthesis C-methylase UbiE
MFEQYWPESKEEYSDRNPDSLVGWPENYPYISDCHKVLDIGCGIGNVVEWLNKRGHDAYGITCQTAERTQAIVRGRSTIFHCDMHDIKFLNHGRDNEFDAFTMWDSLEHSIAPLIALMEARRVTRNGGKGMLFIPGQNWIDYTPHIIVPTMAQMRHLLKQAGLKLVDMINMSNGGTAPEQAVYKVMVEK